MKIDIERIQQVSGTCHDNWDEMLHRAALMYAEEGIKIVPLRPGSKALPPRSSGMNYYSASSNARTMDKWFNPVMGKYRGHNIGIATGHVDGIFVIDADVKKGVNGIDQLHELEDRYGKIPPHPIQHTPGGGEHHIFLWSNGLVSGTSKLDTGIDTRGGKHDSSGGHIVVWPSIVNRKMYTWVEGGSVGRAPDWVLGQLGVHSRGVLPNQIMAIAMEGASPIGSGKPRGNEEVTEQEQEQVMPVGKIKELLSYIDPNNLSYDEWLHVGQSIHSQYPNVTGLMVWDVWSKDGDRYDYKECRQRWGGFDPNGSIRLGTLIHMAKQNGFRTKTDIIEEDVVDRLNKTHSVVVVGGKIRILVEKDTKDLEPWMTTYDLLSKEDFKTSMSNRLHPALTTQGKPTMRSEAEIWLTSEERREYPRGIGFFPGSKAPTGVFNTWPGWTIQPEPGDCDLFIEYIWEVICDRDDKLAAWVIDWMADIIQDPGDPKGTALVMRGEEGTGKGTLYQWISPLMGQSAIQLIDESHLTGQFNAHMLDCILLFADEITWGGNKKGAGKLKGLVTEKYVLGERKGIDAVKYKNHVRLLISSNSDWVIPAGISSRRWCVLDVPKTRKGDREYFNRVYREIKNSLPHLMYFLLNRKITSNLREAPVTKGLHTQRSLSLENDISSALAYWMGKLRDGDIGNIANAGEVDDLNEPHTPWPKYIDRMETYADYEEYCSKNKIRPKSNTLFYKDTTRIGIKTKRPRGGQLRKRAFELPEIEKARGLFTLATSADFNQGEDNDDD